MGLVDIIIITVGNITIITGITNLIFPIGAMISVTIIIDIAIIVMDTMVIITITPIQLLNSP